MSFSKILGQEAALERLKRLAKDKRLPPALLFHGPSGVGKTSAALELAKALNCARLEEGDPCGACASCQAADKGIDPDISRLNASYQAGLAGEEADKQNRIKIDTVRHLAKDLEMRSAAGRWKVAVIEEAHRMVLEAQNAILKALEEPPARTLWILVTPHRDQILPTVRSRCRPVAFRPLPEAVLRSILASLSVPPGDAARLAMSAEGSADKALNLFKRGVPDPSAWLGDPLAPFRLADRMPRELQDSRQAAEDHLRAMAWHVKAREAGPLRPAGRRAIWELDRLLGALKANANPRLAVELGALEIQRLESRRP